MEKNFCRVNKRKSLLIFMLLKALCLFLSFCLSIPSSFSVCAKSSFQLCKLCSLSSHGGQFCMRDLSQKVWFQLQFPSTLIGFGFIEAKALPFQSIINCLLFHSFGATWGPRLPESEKKKSQ